MVISNRRTRLVCTMSSIVLLPLLPFSLALAQSAAPEATDSGTIEDVVVTGLREGERKALKTKEIADNTVDAIFANDVGKLPDQNVAEALRRLPGIAVANDQGEGRYVVIRGVDPALINVTLNGQTLPAPEPDGRNVKLDDIPSGMIGSIVVSKSLLPDQDANAIGGEVAIRTVTAFDVNRPFFTNVRGSGGIYELNGKHPWEADGQIGGLFGSDRRFGVVISANISSRPIESENFQGTTGWAPVNGFVVPDYQGLRNYNLTRTRKGFVGNFDWQVSDGARLYLRSSYSEFSDNEFRDQNILSDADDFANQTATGGTLTAASSIKMRRRIEEDNTKSGTLGGEFKLGGGLLETSMSFARATKKDPIRSEYTFNGPTVDVNYELGGTTYGFLPVTTPFDTASLFTFNKVNYDHRLAVEDLGQARIDYSHPLPFGEGSSIKVGVKYLDRHKSDDEESTAYKKGTAWKLSDDIAFIGDTSFYDRYHFGERINWDAATAYVAANPGVVKLDSSGSIADSLAADYDVREKITAGYVMATLKFGSLTLVPGVRVEHTEDEVRAHLVTEDSTLNDPWNSFGSNSYTDVFPGLNARWELSHDLLVRGAVTTAIGRPNYPDLAPYVVVEDDTVPAISLGNPDLKPYKAVNVDASLEYYLPSQGVLAVGVFHKHISDPVYLLGARVSNATFGGVSYPLADLTQPFNADEENITGFELNAQAQFTFLPGWLGGFGAGANFTHVTGDASAASVRAGDIPLLNQSSNSGTAQLFYEKHGLVLRVAYSYRSKYLDTLGGDASTDQYTDANGQLDVHASYQITPSFTVMADATNLNDAPWRRFIGTSSQLVEREHYGASYRIGVQLHF